MNDSYFACDWNMLMIIFSLLWFAYYNKRFILYSNERKWQQLSAKQWTQLWNLWVATWNGSARITKGVARNAPHLEAVWRSPIAARQSDVGTEAEVFEDTAVKVGGTEEIHDGKAIEGRRFEAAASIAEAVIHEAAG